MLSADFFHNRETCENTTEEMSVEICEIPEDILENILLRLDPERLLGCSRVCKDWSNLILSGPFWMRKLSSEGHNLPRTVSSNEDLDWRFFFLLASHYSKYKKLSFGSNILQNGSGELETEETVLLQGNRNEEDFDTSWFKCWCVLSSGGSGWRLFPRSSSQQLPASYFATSSMSCTKEQLICLAEAGIPPRVLDDYKPEIEVEELYSNHPGQPASYELRVGMIFV